MSVHQLAVYQTTSNVGTVTIPLLAGHVPVIEFINASGIGPATATIFNVYVSEIKGYAGQVMNFWTAAAASAASKIDLNFAPSGLKAYGATSNTVAVTVNARFMATIAGGGLTNTSAAPVTLVVGWRYEQA